MTFVKQIAHTCMMTHDLAAAEHFYCEVLGLNKASSSPKAARKLGFISRRVHALGLRFFIIPMRRFRRWVQSIISAWKSHHSMWRLRISAPRALKSPTRNMVLMTHGTLGPRGHRESALSCSNILPRARNSWAAIGLLTGELAHISGSQSLQDWRQDFRKARCYFSALFVDP